MQNFYKKTLDRPGTMCYNTIRKGKENPKHQKGKNMKEEMIKRIKEIEDSRFWLSMKDRWSYEDRRRDDELLRELLMLRKKVNEI